MCGVSVKTHPAILQGSLHFTEFRGKNLRKKPSLLILSLLPAFLSTLWVQAAAITYLDLNKGCVLPSPPALRARRPSSPPPPPHTNHSLPFHPRAFAQAVSLLGALQLETLLAPLSPVRDVFITSNPSPAPVSPRPHHFIYLCLTPGSPLTTCSPH